MKPIPHKHSKCLLIEIAQLHDISIENKKTLCCETVREGTLWKRTYLKKSQSVMKVKNEEMKDKKLANPTHILHLGL